MTRPDHHSTPIALVPVLCDLGSCATCGRLMASTRNTLNYVGAMVTERSGLSALWEPRCNSEATPFLAQSSLGHPTIMLPRLGPYRVAMIKTGPRVTCDEQTSLLRVRINHGDARVTALAASA